MKHNKKILIFHPYLAPYRIDLYNKLAENYDLFVLLTGSKEEFQTLGYDLEYVNSQAKFKYKYVTKGLRFGRHLISRIFFKVIKDFIPDIIITHELGLNTLFAIFANRNKRKYKIFTTIDDSPSMALNYNKKRELLRRFVANNIDGFIVVNPIVKDYLENKYSAQKNKIIYLPIIQNDEILLQKINNSIDKSIYYKQKYKLNNKKIVLFVGRLEKIKSPDILLNNFEQIDSNKCVLVMVGNGSLQKYLNDYIKQNKINNIILTGRLSGDDLYAWYYLADVFVLPSRFEPFGAVVNEALVAGCYTIVSNKVGANSLITNKNGLIFDINNENELKDIIESFIENIPSKKIHKSLMDKTFCQYYEDLINCIDL